jgi:ABC-type glycerol-3-phosphate transport system substrate-binding protein
MRSWRLAFALATGLFLVSSACTSGSNGPKEQATGTATAASKVTLTDFDYDTFSSAAGKKLISEYEQSHPGVTIQAIHPPPGNLVSYIDTQLAGGTAPDIMTLATDEQTWKDLDKGWWLDLTQYAQAPDPYVPGNKHWIDLLTPGAASQLRFMNGHIYSLTTTGFDVAFFYNKTIFSKLGIAVPQTWDELISDYQKIKAAGYIPLDIELGDTEYADQTEAFITILEGTLMNGDIQKMDTNHDGVVDICELVAGIKNGSYSANNADYQASWNLEKSLAPYLELGAASQTSSDDGFNLFKTGKVATWFEGSFNGPSLAGTGERFPCHA